jgi:hypothetical protein
MQLFTIFRIPNLIYNQKVLHSHQILLYGKSRLILAGVCIIILLGSFATSRVYLPPSLSSFNQLVMPVAAAASATDTASGINSGTERESQSTATPSLREALSSIIDFSHTKITSSNDTGLEAILPLKDGLIWHISVNSIPHVVYTPTQQDLQRVRATGEPLYNVNVRKTITDNDISSSAMFFVPYSAIQFFSSSPSPSGKTIEEGSAGEGGSKDGGGEKGDPVDKANDARGQVEGVVGVIHGWLEDTNAPILETSGGKLISRFLEIYDVIGKLADLGMFGKKIYEAYKELKKYDECRKGGLPQFSDESAKRTEDYVTNAKMDIVVNFLMNYESELLIKVIETGGPLWQALAYPVSKYGDKVFEDIIKDDLNLIKQVSPCTDKPEKLTDEQKQRFQECLLLLHKNLKNFAMNDCLNKKETTPPLQQFVPNSH